MKLKIVVTDIVRNNAYKKLKMTAVCNIKIRAADTLVGLRRWVKRKLHHCSCSPNIQCKNFIIIIIQGKPRDGASGAQLRLKSWGGPRFGSQHRGACASRPAKGRAGCRRGSSPPAVRVRGYHPGKIYENPDAKSCILVTTCCEFFFAFWKLQPRSWGTNTLLVPSLKVRVPLSPVPVVAPVEHSRFHGSLPLFTMMSSSPCRVQTDAECTQIFLNSLRPWLLGSAGRTPPVAW